MESEVEVYKGQTGVLLLGKGLRGDIWCLGERRFTRRSRSLALFRGYLLRH